jgi:hypothetical protein
MTAGTIGGASTSGLGNTDNSLTGGGGVVVKGGTYTMSGGSVSGNTAANTGGGVLVDGGTFTLSGGTIGGVSTSGLGNTATSTGGVGCISTAAAPPSR